MLIFRLARPARVEVTVFGPGPACNRLGTFGRRGRAGLNRIRFSGHLFGRQLPPGRYVIVVTAVRGKARTIVGSVVVALVARDGREGGNRALATPDCRTDGAAFSADVVGGLGGGTSADGSGSRASGAEDASGVAGVSETRSDDGGFSIPGIDAVPALPKLPNADALGFRWASALAGVLVALSVLAGTAGAVYYVRRSRESW